MPRFRAPSLLEHGSVLAGAAPLHCVPLPQFRLGFRRTWKGAESQRWGPCMPGAGEIQLRRRWCLHLCGHRGDALALWLSAPGVPTLSTTRGKEASVDTGCFPCPAGGAGHGGCLLPWLLVHPALLKSLASSVGFASVHVSEENWPT